MSNMKKIYILAFFVILMACNSEKKTSENPTTLEGKRELLEKKKEDLAELEAEIAELIKDILEIDPALEKKKKIVTTTRVAKSDFEKYIEIEGIVIADETVNVVSETPGRIIELNVKEGDYVKKDDLIARIDLETYNKQKAELQTSLRLAKDIYERQAKLWAQNIGSEVQYLQAKNNKERIEKSLEILNYQLSKAYIYAPISGVVDREITKLGEFASPGMPIVQLLNIYNVKVSADLPERYITVLKRGMKVDVAFPSLDRNTTGRVSLLGRRIDPANRTLNFEVDVTNPGGILKPNLLSELKIREKNLIDTIVLPVELVQEDVAGEKYVIKVSRSGGDHIANRVSVDVGDIYEGNAVIIKGIKVGDEIVLDGARLVADGEVILIANEINTANEKGS